MLKTSLATLFSFLAPVWGLNPSICLMVLISVLAVIGSSIGLCFDQTMIHGEFAWVKPLKFSISFVLYGASLIFISQYLGSSKRLLKATSVAALFGSIAELGVIVAQALLASHVQSGANPLIETVLWFVVKLAIMPVAFAILAMLLMLLREKNLPTVLGSSICWGALLSIVGFIPGFLMLMPESMQHVFCNQSLYDHVLGHLSSASKIPYLGWSQVVGDLRVAHFVGLHALQLLPMLGYAVTKLFRDYSIQRQTALVSVAGFTYFAFVILLTMQALHGESIFSPGHSSINAFFTLSAISASAAAFILMPIRIAKAVRVLL